MIVERITSGWPVPPLTNQDRREIWRRKYNLVPLEEQIGATELRRESRTLQNAITPPDGVANPSNGAPAAVATAGTFWARFLAMPSLDWVESGLVIGLTLFLSVAALLLKVSA